MITIISCVTFLLGYFIGRRTSKKRRYQEYIKGFGEGYDEGLYDERHK